MIINFRNRELARKFHSQRKNKGLNGKLIDNGPKSSKRYSVDIRPK